jgi:translation initiation factor 1
LFYYNDVSRTCLFHGTSVFLLIIHRFAEGETHSMDSDLVFSTGQGRMCPECKKPVAHCECAARRNSTVVSRGKTVSVGRETQGRKGKGVTVIKGLPLSPADLLSLATSLKRKLGSGGTVRDGVIEIQGDHRDALVKELAHLGFAAKRSGG